MLNDLKDWATEKGEQSKELAQSVSTEVQTKGMMEWSGTVWIVVIVVAAVVAFGIFDFFKEK